MDRREGQGGPRLRLAAAAAALAAAAVYAHTLGYALVWDDLDLVGQVRGLAERGGLGALLTAPFDLGSGRAVGYWRPVVLVSLWLDGAVGAGAWPYHLTNVLLHAANAAQVCAVAGGVAGAGWPALAAGLLFAVHPAHVEAVAWVSGRTDLWATLFVLLATLAWQRGRFAPAGRPAPSVWRWAGAGALALAALSKELAFGLPAVLGVWDLLQEGRAGWWRRNRGWLFAWGAALAVVAALRVGVASVGFGASEVEPGADAFAPLRRDPRLALGLWASYLRLLVLPWPLKTFYTADQIGLGPLALAGSAVLAALVAWTARPPRLGLVGLVWIGAFLLPVSGLVVLRGAIVAERFLYLPSVGLCLAAAAATSRLAGGRAWTAGLGAALAGLAWAQVPVWRDGFTLFTEMTRTTPGAAVAHLNLGAEYLDLGRPADAVGALGRALALDPAYAAAHYNLGNAYTALGLGREAEAAYLRALALKPAYGVAQGNLGVLYFGQGRYEEAARMWAGRLRLEPGDALTHNNLGMALLELGRPVEAVQALGNSLRVQPGFARAWNNLDRVCRERGAEAGVAQACAAAGWRRP